MVPLGEKRDKETIMQEVKQFVKQINQVSQQQGLEITKHIILQHEIAQEKVHVKLSWMWNNVQCGSISILTKALEVKM